MDYKHYTTLEFAMDEYFQQWVYTQDAEAANFWHSYLALYPDKKDAIEEARALLLSQSIKKDEWSPERMQAIQARISSSLQEEDKAQKKTSDALSHHSQESKKLPLHYLVAAASILLISIILPVYLLTGKQEVFTTGFGETKSLTLPDGSEVILNANSSLSFAQDWQEKGSRQVWLEGEAFFTVSKLSAGNNHEAIKFIVHLEGIDVEVVGTVFNVNHRYGKVEVSLDEGVVDLKVIDGERLRMVPGDMIAYSAETQKIDKRTINSKKIAAWRNHQMMLDGQPLSDLAQLIKNYYGVEVRFSSAELADRKIKTTLPTDNLELVLETLELLLGVKSEREEDVIILK